MQSRSKQDTRNKLKKGISGEESRRKREDQSAEIRKAKREEGLMQKRRAQPAGDVTEAQRLAASPSAVGQLAQRCYAAALEDMQAGVSGLRKLLSLERSPPIAQVVASGVVPRLVELLQVEAVQLEAAWALTNIASGESHHTLAVLQAGAVPPLVALLRSPKAEMVDQVIWALGNIAGDSAECRNAVLQQGALLPLLDAVRGGLRTGPVTLVRNAVWLLSNLCRGKPSPPLESLLPALPMLGELLHSSDTEVVVDGAWALSYLSDGEDSRIDAVLAAGVAPRLVALLQHAQPSIQTPALRAVGNIVTGTDSQTQRMLDLDLLPALRSLLSSARKGLRKEAAWTISNLTAGNAVHTQLVLESHVMPQLVSLLQKGEWDVKKECAWAISNATTWRRPEQIRQLIHFGILPPLVAVLSGPDPKIVGVALDALENILVVGSNSKTGENIYTRLIEEAEGIDRLEELQSHENEGVYKKALHLLETYFGGEEEVENMAPSVVNNQFFSFSANSPSSGFVF